MYLDVKERTKKIDAVPTIQCRITDAIFKKFSKLAQHYNGSNAELLRALIDSGLKRHKEVI